MKISFASKVLFFFNFRGFGKRACTIGSQRTTEDYVFFYLVTGQQLKHHDEKCDRIWSENEFLNDFFQIHPPYFGRTWFHISATLKCLQSHMTRLLELEQCISTCILGFEAPKTKAIRISTPSRFRHCFDFGDIRPSYK